MVRIVDGLEREQFRIELVGNEEERGILVEDLRIARIVFRLQVEVVAVVTHKPGRSTRVHE